MPKRDIKRTVTDYFNKFDYEYITAHLNVFTTISGLLMLSAYVTAFALGRTYGLDSVANRLWVSLAIIVGAPLFLMFFHLVNTASFESMEPATEENLNDPEYVDRIEMLASGDAAMPQLIIIATSAAVIFILFRPFISSITSAIGKLAP